MKKSIFVLLVSIIVFSCSQKPETLIEHIEGYWEIESVLLSNGVKREYKVNQTIDYISIGDSLKGFRKKMNPRFDGKYETSKDSETLQLKIENDSLNLYYSTEFSNWKETVLMANKSQLKIINQNNNVYLYKRFTPIIVK
ncbi:hypothetical protein [Lacinutrix sp. Bg11-31]|uniref:hypothetical protein n=1 Tax=Lacinutrix sp. Bg11-31 TaxID=2057808 RepID=UPI000C310B18|nr:hypothetical protein [Lacinutrix sp. Bg11-31]AUC80869.1 hypothetical protein CW733_01450 [Lacinutrix sp. Bg11-31]